MKKQLLAIALSLLSLVAFAQAPIARGPGTTNTPAAWTNATRLAVSGAVVSGSGLTNIPWSAVTKTASGAVPLNADSTATTLAQLQTLGVGSGFPLTTDTIITSNNLSGSQSLLVKTNPQSFLWARDAGITSYGVSDVGSGYSSAVGVAVTGGTGIGATFDTTIIAGSVDSVVVNNPGRGYSANDLLTLAGGGGDATVLVYGVGVFGNAVSMDSVGKLFIDGSLSVKGGIVGGGDGLADSDSGLATGDFTGSSGSHSYGFLGSVAVGAFGLSSNSINYVLRGSFAGGDFESSSNVNFAVSSGIGYIYVDHKTNITVTLDRSMIVGLPPNEYTAAFESSVGVIGADGSFTGLNTNGFVATATSGAPTAITFPASDTPWTNTTGVIIELYIDNVGITGTAIKKNGVQILGGLITGYTLMLRPGDYFSETYTIGTPSAKYSKL